MITVSLWVFLFSSWVGYQLLPGISPTYSLCWYGQIINNQVFPSWIGIVSIKKHLHFQVSTGLAERYRSLNKSVIETSTGRLTANDWQNLRERYAALSALVKKVDSKISGIILLSFINNIYFICLQLLNGLAYVPPWNYFMWSFLWFYEYSRVFCIIWACKWSDNCFHRPMSEEKPIMNSIYFFGSFMFLIGRTISVTLLAARINDQCKIILPAIYTCPSVDYCVEVSDMNSTSK